MPISHQPRLHPRLAQAALCVALLGAGALAVAGGAWLWRVDAAQAGRAATHATLAAQVMELQATRAVLLTALAHIDFVPDRPRRFVGHDEMLVVPVLSPATPAATPAATPTATPTPTPTAPAPD
jgi:hypothetical protein